MMDVVNPIHNDDVGIDVKSSTKDQMVGQHVKFIDFPVFWNGLAEIQWRVENSGRGLNLKVKSSALRPAVACGEHSGASFAAENSTKSLYASLMTRYTLLCKHLSDTENSWWNFKLHSLDQNMKKLLCSGERAALGCEVLLTINSSDFVGSADLKHDCIYAQGGDRLSLLLVPGPTVAEFTWIIEKNTPVFILKIEN
jgi:hypothetical protein